MKFTLRREGLGEPLEQREQGRQSAVVLYLVVVSRERERERLREKRESYYEMSCFVCLLFIDLERKTGAVSKLRRDSGIESTTNSEREEILGEATD